MRKALAAFDKQVNKDPDNKRYKAHLRRGLCTMWPQAGAVAALGAGLVWNMTRSETGSGDSGNKDQALSQS